MPIRINAVTITPTVTTVGQPVVVVISAEDVMWNNLRADFTDWGEVYRSFSTWDKVKNYIYTKYNPTADANCIYSSDGYALFDRDGAQLSTAGGYTLQHTATEVDSFIREVLGV